MVTASIDRLKFWMTARCALVEAAQRAPERGHHAGEAADAAHHAAHTVRPRSRRPGCLDARQARGEQHGRTPDRQDGAQHHSEPGHVQHGQQLHAQRHAGQPAGHEGPQHFPVETAPHREHRQQLAGQRAEHGQRGRQARIQRQGPERHRHHAEREARQTLHESRHGRAQPTSHQPSMSPLLPVARRAGLRPPCPARLDRYSRETARPRHSDC